MNRINFDIISKSRHSKSADKMIEYMEDQISKQIKGYIFDSCSELLPSITITIKIKGNQNEHENEKIKNLRKIGIRQTSKRKRLS